MGMQSQGTIAPRQLIQFKWADSRNIQPGTPLGYYTYTANSLFDPNQTGAGNQPVGFDQWAAFYLNYRVYKTTYKVSFSGYSVSPGTMCCCIPGNTVVVWAAGDMQKLLSQPYVKTKVLQMGSNTTEITGVLNHPAILGLTAEQYRNSENTSSGTAASPTDASLFQVVLATQDQASNVNVAITVQFTFYSEMFGRLTLNVS